MQCVERGLVFLDTDVRKIVFELQDLDIMQAEPNDHGHESVVPMRKNTAPITLRFVN